MIVSELRLKAHRGKTSSAAKPPAATNSALIHPASKPLSRPTVRGVTVAVKIGHFPAVAYHGGKAIAEMGRYGEKQGKRETSADCVELHR